MIGFECDWPEPCDCAECLGGVITYSEYDLHWDDDDLVIECGPDCWCENCAPQRKAEINRSPAAIVYTDEYLLDAWVKGKGIKSAYGERLGQTEAKAKAEDLDMRIAPAVLVTAEEPHNQKASPQAGNQ